MRHALAFAAAGLLLGLGSPLGALLLRRFLYFDHWELGAFLQAELQTYPFFYRYMLVGTSLIFALVGFLVGHHQDRLAREALTDARTGLANLRRLEGLLEELRADRRLRGKPLSFLMFDLDHFKRVNDRYGHPFGNRVLRTFARILARSIRDTDTAIRYGGEEFLCVLPACDAGEARRIAERIRREMEETEFPAKEGQLRVTVSAGTATRPLTEKLDGKALIRDADRALLQAKRTGRNRVVPSRAKESKATLEHGGPQTNRGKTERFERLGRGISR